MLKLDNVSKLFNPGTPDEKIALLGIDLELNPGISSPLSAAMGQENQR